MSKSVQTRAVYGKLITEFTKIMK